MYVRQLYDLHVGAVGQGRGVQDGCPRESSACHVTSTRDRKYKESTRRCGQNGTCVGSLHGTFRCVCRPGWRGRQCSQSKLNVHLF